MIYVITVMKRHEEQRERSRVWGYYFKFEDAEKVVLNNYTDIFEENHYDLAVIEAVPEGVVPISEVRQWYRADYSGEADSPTVAKIDAPEWSENVFNWGIG